MTMLISLKPCKSGKSHRWSLGQPGMIQHGKCVYCKQERDFTPFAENDKVGWTEGSYASNRFGSNPVIKVNEWY